MNFELRNLKTGEPILTVPTYAHASEHHALCQAGRQARRHARDGVHVILTGAGKSILYTGEHQWVPCERCQEWMLPRRRGNVCRECRKGKR